MSTPEQNKRYLLIIQTKIYKVKRLWNYDEIVKLYYIMKY
jgi:hypothetical protein